MDERLKLVKAARELGAIEIEVDGLKIVFPSNYDGPPVIVDPSKWRHSPAVPPNLEYLAKAGESGDNSLKPPPPAIRGSPDPDEYSRASDMWANYEPSPIRG